MGTSHRQASDGLGHDSFGDDRSDSLEEITANLLRQSVATCRQETLAENHATLLAANIVTAAHRLVSQHGRDAITDATVNDLIAMILRVTPLRPPEAGFIVHMVFSLMQPGRQLSGRLVDRMSREIDDIENMGEFYLVFENLVRELVIDLLWQHFASMGEESLAYTTERIIDRQHGYLSGKLDAEFLRNLASGCEEESEVRMREIMVARLDRRSEGDQPREDLERLREFMLDQNEFEERRSNLFIVRVMPLLDEAYARCAARYVMGCRESTEAI